MASLLSTSRQRNSLVELDMKEFCKSIGVTVSINDIQAYFYGTSFYCFNTKRIAIHGEHSHLPFVLWHECGHAIDYHINGSIFAIDADTKEDSTNAEAVANLFVHRYFKSRIPYKMNKFQKMTFERCGVKINISEVKERLRNIDRYIESHY
jgi:hypothetical protein